MNLFFGNRSDDGNVLLTEDESGHCIRVLRMKAGDEISITDGIGNFYTGKILDPNPKKCLVRIRETKTDSIKRNYSLHVAIAPTKNIDRFEWFLEKATEIGIDEITPVICLRSERKTVKTERLNKVLLSAMKQSLQSWLPRLNEPVAIEKFLSAPQTDEKFICLLNAENHLKDAVHTRSKSIVLIGPEGDFTEQEISSALKNNFHDVSLGSNRLRTETAGIVACSVVSLLNQ